MDLENSRTNHKQFCSIIFPDVLCVPNFTHSNDNVTAL
jgi:hypothetical protein